MIIDHDRSGLSSKRLNFLKSVIEDDIKQGRYYGAAIAIGRHGELGIHEALGYGDGKGKRSLELNSVFSIFSTTKAITNVLVFRAIELGQFALTTKISEVIPEFSGGLRQDITFYHLLTHSSGLPSVYIPRPGMYIDRLDEIIEAICANVHSTEKPGVRVDYSPLAHHALMGEAVRRCDSQNRSYRQLVEDEVLKPLGMRDTAIGVRADLKARHIVPDFMVYSPTEHLGHSNYGPNGAFEEEHAEMPWVGAVSTVGDMYRFAEMLRRGGDLDGVRIVSSTILKRARQNETAQKPNELYKAQAIANGWDPFPAYIGLGFSLRGDTICHHLYGTLTSPQTFGNYGFGSSLFWVDPELDMSFVCLTAGVMAPRDNFERFQRLSDIAVSAAI
jgi:CubicO group peptidase (beta-lactamase class C family)